jgi:hypothetical protein
MNNISQETQFAEFRAHHLQNTMVIIMTVPYLRRLDAGFDPRSSHVGFVVDRGAVRKVSPEYFRVPCQFSFHQMLHTHLSSGAGTIVQLVVGVPSGLSLTPPYETKKM